MKILNLYAGIGGNRKLWGDEHEITAVELNPEIAKIYTDFFPNDKMMITDAHEYLLGHFKEYDFIWASPPCQSHSDLKRLSVHRGQNYPEYIDMRLYQEIILLQYFYKGIYVIENVKPYYDIFIPAQLINRHYFWSNIYLPSYELNKIGMCGDTQEHKKLQKIYDINIDNYNYKDKRTLLRNCVHPKLGRHILNCVENKINNNNIQLNLIKNVR